MTPCETRRLRKSAPTSSTPWALTEVVPILEKIKTMLKGSSSTAYFLKYCQNKDGGKKGI